MKNIFEKFLLLFFLVYGIYDPSDPLFSVRTNLCQDIFHKCGILQAIFIWNTCRIGSTCINDIFYLKNNIIQLKTWLKVSLSISDVLVWQLWDCEAVPLHNDKGIKDYTGGIL